MSDDTTELEAELREAAADRQHLGVNASRFIRAADALDAARTENERLTALLGSRVRLGPEIAELIRERDEARVALTRREAQITEALTALNNTKVPIGDAFMATLRILSATPTPVQDTEGTET